MADTSARTRKETLDKDLDKLVHVEEAASFVSRGLVAPGLALLFLALSAVIASLYVMGQPGAIVIVAAAGIGAYMALNIGANDVANNVGPAVGAKALTIGGALVIAAVFETAGALIGGAEVVNTVSRGIIAPEAGLIVADAWGAEFLRHPLDRPLAPARRKAVTLGFARAAALRLHSVHDPNAKV